MIELSKAEQRTRTELTALIDAKNPVALAVEALREAAITRAAEYAQKRIDAIEEDLKKNGWDMTKACPSPYEHGIGYYDQQSRNRKQALYRSLTERVDAAAFRSSHPRNTDPDIVRMSKKGCVRFISDTKHQAAIQYDLFVLKLVKKVGAGVTHAKAEEQAGIWGCSYLEITGDNETAETWKTQQIINYSKLGTPYNQWPTRLMKGRK